ncbi:hypothetical protein JNUCC0626_43110 [Lentzea sp. JNUCC 0626]|uniref:RICIN domain-containing protein n=1 Tax=Lentzea sp. JNUCC 0626 TaxID=3367513 RepID=UPI00374A6914
MGMKLLSIALGAIALGAVMVAPAGAAEDGNKIIEIKSVLYGECVQADKTPHNTTILPCDGSEAQQWEVVPVDGGRHLLRNVALHRECLSEMYGFYRCDDEQPHGFITTEPAVSGSVRVKFGDSPEYLTALTWSNGERDVLITGFGEPAAQQWELRTVGTTEALPDTTGQVVRIRSAEASTYGCLSLSGTRLLPVPCADVVEQKFQRIEVDGKTAFRSVANGRCLSLGGASAVEPLVIGDCASGDVGQQWSIEPTRLGSARVRSALNTEFLTPGDGWVFVTDTRFSHTWQQWELVPA